MASSPLRGSAISFLLVMLYAKMAGATTFTLYNKCGYGVWPGIASDAGQPLLGSGGFALAPGQSQVLEAPEGWSGRFWVRTGCNFDDNNRGYCSTGDCGGVLECQGAGGNPPVSLAEFTLGQKDFYDVSLVDGYNVEMTVSAEGGAASAEAAGPTYCTTAGCTSNSILGACPAQLVQTDATGQVVACRSACEAFSAPEYCCTGAYSTPQTCGPSAYSQIFKSACPSAYSYAYDDPSSTFTCVGASGYTITFCPQ